jgi:hypothetical protein
MRFVARPITMLHSSIRLIFPPQLDWVSTPVNSTHVSSNLATSIVTFTTSAAAELLLSCLLPSTEVNMLVVYILPLNWLVI